MHYFIPLMCNEKFDTVRMGALKQHNHSLIKTNLILDFYPGLPHKQLSFINYPTQACNHM